MVVGVVLADTSCSPKHITCIDGVVGEPCERGEEWEEVEASKTCDRRRPARSLARQAQQGETGRVMKVGMRAQPALWRTGRRFPPYPLSTLASVALAAHDKAHIRHSAHA